MLFLGRIKKNSIQGNHTLGCLLTCSKVWLKCWFLFQKNPNSILQWWHIHHLKTNDMGIAMNALIAHLVAKIAPGFRDDIYLCMSVSCQWCAWEEIISFFSLSHSLTLISCICSAGLWSLSETSVASSPSPGPWSLLHRARGAWQIWEWTVSQRAHSITEKTK